MSRSTGTWAALQRVEALGRHAGDTLGAGFNGFVDRSTSTITVKKATREVELAGSWVAYSDGARWEGILSTCMLEDTEGLHYIFLNGIGRLESSTTWSDEYITRYALVCIIYWDADNDEAIFIGDERHGCVMDSSTHLYLHNYLGAQYKSGLGLVDFRVDDTGSDDTHAQFGAEAGYIADEDITHSISAFGAPANLPIYYISGASAYWRKDEAGDFVCKSYPGGRLAYNFLDGGIWKQAEISNNQFVLAHIFATNAITEPLIVIQGQADYTTITEAREGATTEINSLVLGGLPTPEFTPIGTVIFQTSNSYANTPKARIRSTDLGDNYVDFREYKGELTAGGGGGVTDHGALTGLADDDHTQYSLVSGARGFTGTVSGIAPTQLAHLATKGYVDGYAVPVGGYDAGKAFYYNAFGDLGTVGGSVSISWTGDGPNLLLTLNATSTITFSDDPPSAGCKVMLIISPGGYSITSWPASVKWPDGAIPKQSTNTDVATFIYDGSKYLGTYVGNFY